MPKKIGKIGFCEACAAGKQSRGRHPRLEIGERATRPGQKLHADLFGPIALQESLGGARYGLVITCDFSHHIWFVGLAFKSEAPRALMTFHTWFRNEFPQYKTSTMRTDGALEFKTAALLEYWRKEGVKHEPSARYCPQSNGVAERAMRTITEITRTLLVKSRLPMFFWPAAAKTAATLKNRLPATGLPHGRTPHEALYGKPPKVAQLVPFGCTAWGLLPEPERNAKTKKLAARSQPCVYLGPVFTGGSRLWDPIKRVEVVEHGCIFDEKGDAAALVKEHKLKNPASTKQDQFALESLTEPIAEPPLTRATPTGSTTRADASMRTAISNALERGVVPEPARATLEAIGRGGHVQQAALGQASALMRTSIAAARARTAAQQASTRISGQQSGTGSQGVETQGVVDQAIQSHGGRQGGEVTGTDVQGELSGSGGQVRQAEGIGAAVRRSARIAGQDADGLALPLSRKRKDPEDFCLAVLDPAEVPYGDPRTVAEAMSRPDWKIWIEAMERELASHQARGTWKVVKTPPDINIVSAKWVFRVKRNADGTIQKYKARLVARGFTQVQGLDYDETFAPTSRLQILRLFCALAASLDMELHQIDFETAYLNATLQHEIYMHPPAGVDLLPDETLQLILALYGLKQSGHDWHAALRDALKTIGFSQCDFDPTIFVREGDRPAILLVYVDDIMVATPKGGDIAALKKELLGLFKGTNLGAAHHCLGIRIERNRGAGTLALDQERYAEEVLDRFGMGDCKAARTPMETKVQLRRATEGEARCDKTRYQAIVGSLAYLAQGKRPDLAYAVSCLGKYGSDPSEEHMTAAKRVLRYLRGTTKTKLTFGHDDGIEGFVDADWAADKDDRRSTSGFVYLVGGGAVSWGSRKQGAVALSTAEAEYIAAGVAGREALLLKGALSAAGQAVGSIQVYCDNQAAIKLVKNPGSHHDRSKHIDIVHHWIREQTQRGAFAFTYIATDKNPADAMTKSLGQIKHKQHAERIGLDFGSDRSDRGSTQTKERSALRGSVVNRP